MILRPVGGLMNLKSSSTIIDRLEVYGSISHELSVSVIGMFQLVYVSTASRAFTEGELFEMLDHFRENNARMGITGLLLYKEESFMQLLEGNKATVRDLYSTIRADQRHHHVNTLLQITVEQRQFPDWSMGFKNLEIVDVSSVQGYKTLHELSPELDILSWKASIAMTLLASFNDQELSGVTG